MHRSDDRILTTHTGSLPRPPDLLAVLEGRDQQEVGRDATFEQRVRNAVREIVERQTATSIDVVNNGEMCKVGYSTYVTERLTGFEGQSEGERSNVEMQDFPDYYRIRPVGTRGLRRPLCCGPISWRGDVQVRRDIEDFTAALAGGNQSDAFMTAASPGVVWAFLENRFYPNDEAYVFAVADALRHEYRAIVDAGFVLQLDCPDLASGWNRPIFAGRPVEEFLRLAALHVDALNHALGGIPSDRVRLHLCWGNFEGPHTRDIPLASIWEIVLGAHAGAFSFEAANPRHAHEWTLFETARLPEGKILIPGVLDSTTNFVEHPELVKQRIVRYAQLVGRENVIAGSDCGFATFARSALLVHPDVTWAKLRAMVEGARLASEQLWG
jgi:5-methyltetrahydropteroyltriglutamate--homocysteine methyltransferase